MASFKPTQDQLADYHLNMTDPELTDKIKNYIANNPEGEGVLNEFEQIEKGFQRFPITEPSDMVLKRVRAMARQEARVGLIERVKQVMRIHLPVRRSLAWVTMIFVVVGLSYALKELRETTQYSPGLATPKVAKTNNGDSLNNKTANFSGMLTEKAMQALDMDQGEGVALRDYTRAMGFFHQSRFKEACDMFSQIMAVEPLFSKRVDLYNTWIMALDKMGNQELAQQKRDELLLIEEEIRGKETM